MLTFSNRHQFYTYTWVNSGEHKPTRHFPLQPAARQARATRGAAWWAVLSAEGGAAAHHTCGGCGACDAMDT